MQKAISNIPPSKIRKFSLLVKKYRATKGLTQNELAKLANVSTKTIVAIEKEKKVFKIIGPKAIAKIAKALDQDPIPWLELWGYKNVPQEKLEEKIPYPGETSSEKFFQRLSTQSSCERPALLCLTFLSRVSQINRENLLIHLSELIKKESLWLAIVVPYPEIMPDKLTGVLSSHFQIIHLDVKNFVTDLSSRLESTEVKRRLGMFVPNSVFTPVPHLTGNLARSNFVKYSGDSLLTKDKDRSYELISWGITPHDGKELWYSIYPSPPGGNLDASLETLKIWKDYYSRLISKFESGESGWGSENIGIWKKIEI